jgi:hypothetical protein
VPGQVPKNSLPEREQRVNRRPTPLDRFYGSPPDVQAIARALTPRLTDQLLEVVWAAYDALSAGFLSHINWNEQFDDLERALTELLADEIQNELQRRGGLLPVGFRHSPYERESRSAAPAQPREYDLGFFFNADKRVLWPLEAKVIPGEADTKRNLGDYVDTVTSRYINCTYAPFVSSGAMIGYLKSGDPETVLTQIAERLSVEFQPYPAFSPRPHQISEHRRTVPPGKAYPVEFCCHHLMLSLRVVSSDGSPKDL